MSQEKELTSFLKQIGVAVKFRIEESFGNGYVRLNIEESQRRQAKHDIRSTEDALIELLRNSRDAGAKNILVASRLRNDKRELWVIDDGKGIPKTLFEKIFEARVTSKVDKIIEDEYGIHGRGMALYAIRSRAVDSKVIKSTQGNLTSIKITTDTNTLPEKKDQSSFPLIKKSKGSFEFKGPLNIPRIICEFAFKYPMVNFYYGLPSQIAGNLIKLSQIENRFIDFKDNSIDDFSDKFSNYFGFELSKRNAYRCLSSELSGIEIKKYFKSSLKKNLNKIKGLSALLDNGELSVVASKAGKDLNEIAEKYNVAVVDAKVIKKGNAVKIILTLEKDEDI